MSYLPVSVYDWYLRNVVIGEREAQSVASAEQGTALWHDARRHRASGSRVGDMIGLGFHPTSLASLTKLFVWPEPLHSPYLTWGTESEIRAQKVCEAVLAERFAGSTVTFEYPGGIVIRGDEWFIASVDGLAIVRDPSGAEEVILLEFKCPRTPHKSIKPGYYAQIQSYMGFLRQHSARYSSLRRCIFAQWTPSSMEFSEFEFDEDWFHQLKTMAEHVYFTELAPRFILRNCGLLKQGQVRLQEVGDSKEAVTLDDEPPLPKRFRAKRMRSQ